MPATYPYQQQRRPTANFRTSEGPNGYTNSQSFSGIPVQVEQAPPMMSPDHYRMQQNMGIAPRGPTPQFAASPMGRERFPQMQQGQAPQAPMLSGGMNVGTAPGAAAMGGASASTTLGKIEYGRLKDQHAILLGRYKAMAESNAAEAQKLLPQITAIEGRMFPESNEVPGGHSMGDLQSQQSTSQQAPQMRSPVAPPAPLPMSGPAYDARVRQMYGTAGADLAERPLLGVKPAPETPIPPLTPPPSGMGNSPADYRQASGQAYKNQAAIARTNDAGRQQTLAQNQGQMRQNSQAMKNIEAKGPQFDAARAATTQPAQPAQAAATTQPAVPGFNPTSAQATPQQMQGETQSAQATAPTSQPSQAQGTPLTQDLAVHFLRQAGNDRAKAEQMARAAGFSF